MLLELIGDQPGQRHRPATGGALGWGQEVATGDVLDLLDDGHRAPQEVDVQRRSAASSPARKSV